MIWHLIKRDPAWRFTMPIAALFAALAVLQHLVGPRWIAPEALTFAFGTQLFGLAAAMSAQQGDTPFESTLPVALRQIFMARMVGVLALMGSPVLAGTLVLLAVKDPGLSVIPMGTWSILPCIALLMQCAVIRGHGLQPGASLVALWLACAMFYAVWQRWVEHSPKSEVILVAACWLISVAIVVRTWRAIPASFQLEPAEALSAARPSSPAIKARTRRQTWMVLFHAISPRWGLGLLYVFAITTVFYSPLLVLFLVISRQEWGSTRSGLRWMLSLPIAPRTMMAMAVLPGTVTLICGYLIGDWLTFSPYRVHHVNFRTLILNIIFLATLSMLWNLLSMAAQWRPSKWIAVTMMVAMAGSQIWLILQVPADPLHWLSSALPASLTGAIAITILLTGTLFIAMDRLFRRLELL